MGAGFGLSELVLSLMHPRCGGKRELVHFIFTFIFIVHRLHLAIVSCVCIYGEMGLVERKGGGR